jgi:hypothetical protein
MRLFVITYGTKDYGDCFVVREHVDGVANTKPFAFASGLEEARGAIEEYSPSLVRLDRNEWDDSVIVESWGSRADVERCEQVAASLVDGAFL